MLVTAPRRRLQLVGAALPLRRAWPYTSWRMSSTPELVYLAEGLWRDRPLKFIAAPFMGQRPELRRGEGVSFGTFLTRDGPKTGWLFVPNPSSRNAAGKQLGEHLRAANPGLSKAALERLELGQLRYQFAEQRRLKERGDEARRLAVAALRLARLPQQTGPTQVPPPVSLPMIGRASCRERV